MSIDEFRSLLQRLDHLEKQIVASRERAEAVELSGTPESEFLTRLIFEMQSSIKGQREINLAFVKTNAEMKYLSHLVMYVTAAPVQIADTLREIETALASDESLCRSLTPAEHSWITEKIGFYEIVKHTAIGREFRGELPLLHLPIIRSYLRRCGGGRFTLVRHSRMRTQDIELQQEVATASDEQIDSDDFLRSISVQV